MTVRLYADHNLKGAVIRGLQDRGVDILRAFEDKMHRADDAFLLRRAVLLDRVLVTHDDDFLAEAARYQRLGHSFPGILYVHQTKLTIGELIRELMKVAMDGDPEVFADQVLYLPLQI